MDQLTIPIIKERVKNLCLTNDVVTNVDVTGISTYIDQCIDDLVIDTSKINAVSAALDAKINAVSVNLTTKINTVSTDLDTKISDEHTFAQQVYDDLYAMILNATCKCEDNVIPEVQVEQADLINNLNTIDNNQYTIDELIDRVFDNQI